MKYLLLLLVCLGGGIAPLMAQSMLKVSLANRQPITVSVDGRYFNKRGESVTVGDLPSGRHMLRVYITRRNDDGNMVPSIVYEGRIRTSFGLLTDYVIDIQGYNPNVVSTQRTIGEAMQEMRQDQIATTDQRANNYDQRGQQYMNMDTLGMGQQGEQQGNTALADSVVPALPAGTPVASPISLSDDEASANKPMASSAPKNPKVTAIMKALKPLKTDTEKLVKANEMVDKIMLNSYGVAQIMTCFVFESSKVEFAKHAYNRVTDKGNFKSVKAGLTMKSYRQEIDKLMAAKKK